jgi:hypothetical protein
MHGLERSDEILVGFSDKSSEKTRKIQTDEVHTPRSGKRLSKEPFSSDSKGCSDVLHPFPFRLEILATISSGHLTPFSRSMFRSITV